MLICDLSKAQGALKVYDDGRGGSIVYAVPASGASMFSPFLKHVFTNVFRYSVRCKQIF